MQGINVTTRMMSSVGRNSQYRTMPAWQGHPPTMPASDCALGTRFVVLSGEVVALA